MDNYILARMEIISWDTIIVVKERNDGSSD